MFYDGPFDLQIWALLTRSHCSVSNTQGTVKAHGPLVIPAVKHFVIVKQYWNLVSIVVVCDSIDHKVTLNYFVIGRGTETSARNGDQETGRRGEATKRGGAEKNGES